MPNRTTRAMAGLAAAKGRSFLTTGVVARRLGCPTWAVRRLYERNILPPADRIGQYRIVNEDDLPKIRDALVAAGYIAVEAGAAGAERASSGA